jgi:hypothetical protein
MSIDPLRQTCNCGYSWKPRLYHKIIMLIYGHYTHTCPQCHSRSKLVLVNHVVKIGSEKVLDEMIWRRS